MFLFRKVAATALVAASLLSAPCCSLAQGMQAPAPTGKKPLLSPPADATVELDGKTVNIHYSRPSMRGRAIFGGLVPYGKVWRTGANPATTLTSPVALKIGSLTVPAGEHTIYSLPGEGTMILIVNEQTGQWGTEYNADQDVGRTEMVVSSTPQPLETFTMDFENTKGKTTELHLKWETRDAWVQVTVQ